MDLGSTKRDVKTHKIKVLSEFEMKYLNIFKNNLLKYGSIGSVTFYEDLRLKEKKYYIFKNDEIYEIEYDERYLFTD